jgi:hypothetical protein
MPQRLDYVARVLLQWGAGLRLHSIPAGDALCSTQLIDGTDLDYSPQPRSPVHDQAYPR